MADSMTNAGTAPEQAATQPAETVESADAWESGATERTQERLEADATIETLYGEDDEQKDDAGQPTEEPNPAPETKPAAEAKPALPTKDALWSSEDVAAITTLQQQAQAFQTELAQFAEYRAADVTTLAGGDKAKAAAIESDLKDWERNLSARYQALQQQAAGLQEKATERQTGQLKERLNKEAEKLSKAFPDLDKKALRSYLLETAGFTTDEVKGASDARVVTLAEKARRYDEIMANGGPKGKKIPTRRTRDQGDDGIVPSMGKNSNIFQRMAAVDAMYPTKPTNRRAASTDDPATILYGAS